MIILEVNNEPFTNFTEIEVSISLDTVSGSFRFVAVSKEAQTFPFKEGDECRVIVDDVPRITGFIDVIDGSYDTQSHIINIEGRSKTADLIDSSLENAVDFIPPMTLASVTEQIIAEADIDTIEVVVEEELEPFGDGEIEGVASGEQVFSALERFARKRQVLITDNADGDIVYTRGFHAVSGGSLINDPNLGSNIKSARWRNDNSDRFNKYFVQAQQNVSGLAFLSEVSVSEVVDQKSQVAVDDTIRATRKMVVNAESASDKDQSTARAIWEANIRRTRSFSYSATVAGHSHSSGPWELNTLVPVQDIWARKEGVALRDQLLINSLTFRQNLTEGSTTEVGCVVKDAYSLQASEPIQAQEIDILAGIFN